MPVKLVTREPDFVKIGVSPRMKPVMESVWKGSGIVTASALDSVSSVTQRDATRDIL